MLNKFSEKARNVINYARQEAQFYKHDSIDTGHLLLGLIHDEVCVAAVVLKQHKINISIIRSRVEKFMQPGVFIKAGSQEQEDALPFTPRSKNVLTIAADEARALGHLYIGTEHLLLALIKDGEGIACRVLQESGLKFEELSAELKELLKVNIDRVPVVETAKDFLDRKYLIKQGDEIGVLKKRIQELEDRIKKLEES